MKKRVSLLLIFALVFSMILTGCKKEDSVYMSLWAEYANLEYGKDLIIESDDSYEYNLGHWLDGNIAMWDIEIEREGFYNIDIEYSRPGGTWGHAWGLIEFHDKYGVESEIYFKAKPTGNYDDDWSIYETDESCTVKLYPGTYVVTVQPDPDDTGWQTRSDFFINLRRLGFYLEA